MRACVVALAVTCGVTIQRCAMIANMALALAGLIDYRSLTLRTRGVHLHLRVVATRRYSKSYGKRFHGDWRAATPPRARPGLYPVHLLQHVQRSIKRTTRGR